MKTKLTLLVEVDFEHPRKQDVSYLRSQLLNVASHASANGMFSGNEGDLEVASWEAQVLEGQPLIVPEGRRKDLGKLLDYNQEVEEKHYEEGRMELGTADPACRNHIWLVVKRLAKSVGHSFG